MDPIADRSHFNFPLPAAEFPAASEVLLGPRRFGGERHQDRLDIAAGLQTEGGAAVVEQVELDIAAAANELMTALLGRPGLPHTRPHDGRDNGEDGVADRSEEGEVALPIAAVEVVEE